MAVKTTNDTRTADSRDANRDPLTGEPGAHPVGAGVGAAAGTATGVAAGAAAALGVGAAVGSVAGPVGTLVGAAVAGIAGGIGGGLAGKKVAEAIDPTAEEAFWQENFKTRSYATKGDFETYRPAYRHGVDSYARNQDQSFDQAEAALGQDWKAARGTSKLDWQDAKPAARDAYERLCNRNKGQQCGGG